ncbi:MAG TPA: CHASE3 domain-containing protein [Pirellulales bacterium]|nr:CHASE3 domain-containing protein [Pirellulales bacterium]
MTWNIGRAPRIGFMTVVTILVIDAVISYRNTRRLHENDAAVGHTHEVLSELSQVLASAQEAESRQRGYLITGRESFRTPFQDAIAATRRHMQQLNQLTADNPEQQERIRELEPLVTAKLDELTTTLELLKPRDPVTTANEIARLGTQRMDAIRLLVAGMQGHEYDLLEERSRQASESYANAVSANLLAMLLSVGVIAFAWRSLAAELKARTEAEAAVHAERERLSTTLTSIGDGVIVVDRGGHVVMQNTVAQSLTGWGQNAIGRPIADVFNIIHETTREPMPSPIERVYSQSQIVSLSNRTMLIAQDRVERPIEYNAAPIRDKRGVIVGAVLVFRDVTARRREEQARREADVRKDQFLATLAHELRNPLAPISNALQLWEAVKDDAAQMEELREMMQRQVQQMIRLIDDLLDVSRITRGKIQLRKQRVEIGTLVHGAIEAIQPFIDRCGHKLSLSMWPEPIYLEADVARMVQVFGNIIHNAAKYSGSNGTISVAVERDHDQAVVRVRDNGPGIPQPMLDRIFDIFVQVDQTLDRSHGGLGLGLTLVKNLVEAHAGTVEASSEGPGKGSEFVVRLSALPVAASTDGSETPAAGHPRVGPLPKRSILVVDDVQASAKTLAMMLRAIGQQVETANNGHAALEAFDRNRFQVVFLDIAMPELDGYEVARRIRQHPRGDRVTLIALTGYGQEQDRRQAAAAGFDFHLVKPTSLEALEHVLESAARPAIPSAPRG